MKSPLISALTVALLAMSGPALAQTAEAPAPAEGTEAPAQGTDPLSLGEPVSTEPQIGDTYVMEMFGDWAKRCVKTESGKDPCQLYQLLQDQNGNSVAEISIFPLPAGQQAVAGATIITPLETLLTQQLTMQVDAGQAKRYPFTFCAQIGCVSRLGFLEEEVAALRRGKAATLRIVPAAAPDQEVVLSVSLSGFTAGLQSVIETNAAAQAEN